MDERYIRALLFPVRYAPRRYALVHPGSGTITLTDELGALSTRLLIRGACAEEVRALVERRTAGAGERCALSKKPAEDPSL
jgi:hypothetical protein